MPVSVCDGPRPYTFHLRDRSYQRVFSEHRRGGVYPRLLHSSTTNRGKIAAWATVPMEFIARGLKSPPTLFRYLSNWRERRRRVLQSPPAGRRKREWGRAAKNSGPRTKTPKICVSLDISKCRRDACTTTIISSKIMVKPSRLQKPRRGDRHQAVPQKSQSARHLGWKLKTKNLR